MAAGSFVFNPVHLYRSKSDGFGYHHPFESVIAAAAAAGVVIRCPIDVLFLVRLREAR